LPTHALARMTWDRGTQDNIIILPPVRFPARRRYVRFHLAATPQERQRAP
jgi:hypothetical protein